MQIARLIVRPAPVSEGVSGKAAEFTARVSTGAGLWAYFRHLSGQGIHASGATFEREQVLFVINWRRNVTCREVVRYGGRLYDIQRVDGFEGYREDLSLYCVGRG